MNPKQQLQLNARIFKWKEMLEVYPEIKSNKLKERGRKGVPDPLRGYAWMTLSQCNKHVEGEKSQHFKNVVQKFGSKKNVISIFKDISRTFTHHIYFTERYGKGQENLFKVLKALSIEQEETGYVQGMGYMAGILMIYMDHEDAFFMLLSIMRDYDILDMYRPKMPGLARTFYVHLSLTKKYLPKLHQHLLDNHYEPSMYGSQWFMTIYAIALPFEVVLRIWDIFFAEGKNIIYRIALAILKLNQEKLLTCDLDGIFNTIKQYSNNCDAELLIKTALSYKFSGKLVEKFEEEFRENPREEFKRYITMG